MAVMSCRSDLEPSGDIAVCTRPPEDILHGVAVFEAIVRSAERHQPVTVART
jgi:hypothetical protein